jgi:molecular chaperone HtpG
VNSAYQFGGVVDLLLLEPTAGREAITVDGMQFLQSIMTEIDGFTSRLLAERDEADVSTPFMNWATAHNRFDLGGRLRMTLAPNDRIELREVSERSKTASILLYEGADQGVIKIYASEDTPLLILARNNPRRRCEQNYLQPYAKVTVISDHPVVTGWRGMSRMSIAESGLAFRTQKILESDYF